MSDSVLNETLEAAATNLANNGTTISVQDSVIAYTSLYLMALFCIYFGSTRSVAFVQKHRDEKKKIENSITLRDAKMFPFTASAVLFSLYVFFKYGDQIQDYIALFARNYLGKGVAAAENVTEEVALNSTSMLPKLSKQNVMNGLLLLLVLEGVLALATLLKPLISFVLVRLPFFKPHSEWKENLPYDLSFTRAAAKGSHERTELLHIEFDSHDIVSVAVCSLVGILHVYKRHWITNNIIGLAFSLYGIEALHLSSFKGGVLLLSGLFVYDVFWVFATDVMSTVATSINAPILLMFPQDLIQNGMKASKFAMLGLGDIVIPGIFLALLLRFDTAKTTKARHYFLATVVAYAAGLVLTIGVMHWFKAAQPALLYLVPACVGVPSLLAVSRGEFWSMFEYNEDDLVKVDEKKEKEEKKDN